MTKRAIVLLSGGLDSATVLAMPHGGSTLPYLQDAGPDHSRT